MNKQQKEAGIKKEIDKFQKLFKEIDKDKKQIVDHLIKNVAFMVIVLEELQDTINSEGTCEHFINGKQDFMRESVALKSYNTTIKNLQSSIKQLLDLMPQSNKKETADELLEFLKNK